MRIPVLGVLTGDRSTDQFAADLPPALRAFYKRTRFEAGQRLADGSILRHMQAYLDVLRTVNDPDDVHGWTGQVSDIPFDPYGDVDWILVAEDTHAGDLLAEVRRERSDIYQWGMHIAHSGELSPRSRRRSSRPPA